MYRLFFLMVFATLCLQVSGQKFPLIISADFQNFALPLHDVATHFTNPGLSVGTELALNKKKNWVQQANVGFNINRGMGSSLYLYTQNAVRIHIYRPLYTEVKLGVGYQRAFHPVDAYKFEDGDWVKVQGGKSLLIIPAGLSLFYKKDESSRVIPFISYQAVPTLFYDDVLPLSFYNLIQAGVRINLKPASK